MAVHHNIQQEILIMPVQNRIQFRRGTAAAGANQWTNQVLSAGEVGYETDSGRFKIGDGLTAWDSLEYAALTSTDFVAGSGVTLSSGTNGSTLTISSIINAGSGISVAEASGVYTISLSDPTVNSSDVVGLDEAIDDRVSNLLVSGSGIQLSYNDNANSLTVSVTGIALSGHTHTTSDITNFVDASNDRVADLLAAGSNIQLTYVDNGDDTSTLTVAVTGVSLSGHTHTASNITDFSTAVSGLLPVKDVVAGSGISVSSSSGSFTVSLSDPTIQAADVTDFSEAVDDRVSSLLVAGTGVAISYNDNSNTLTVSSSLSAGSGISVSESSGVYTVSLSDPTIQVADITDLTASATEINYLDGSIPGTGVAGKAVVLDSSLNITNLGNVSTTGNVTVGGDLIVNGTTTTVNSTVTTIDDPILTLGGDTAPGSDDNKDRGIEFRYFSGSAKVGFFGYDDSTGKFTFIPDATNTSEVFSGTKGELDANVDWSNILNKPDPVIAVDITGDVVGSGNFTMTDLAGGTISISSTIQANSVALGSDTTGDYVASVAVSGVGLSVSGSGENATYTVTSNATSSNTSSTIVARDSSGNFTAGTITASGLTGASSSSLVTISYAAIDGGTP
jgi:hypothetical protein